MKERLSIVLVEDDEVACSRFENIADSSDNIAIVGVTNSSGEAVRLIKDNLPDAVILDLELHKGSGSGLDVLSGIGSQLPSSMRPFVLVTTNNTSALIYETARSLGADYILAKHQDDYSEEYAIGLLLMMSDAIRNRHGASDEAAVSPAAQEKRIRTRIRSELDLIGISRKNKGYEYLVDAIGLTVKEPTENLCAALAKRFGKTENSIERAMQNAINRAWSKTSIDELLAHYTAAISSQKGVPTLTEFIYYYANKIKDEY